MKLFVRPNRTRAALVLIGMLASMTLVNAGPEGKVCNDQGSYSKKGPPTNWRHVWDECTSRDYYP